MFACHACLRERCIAQSQLPCFPVAQNVDGGDVLASCQNLRDLFYAIAFGIQNNHFTRLVPQERAHILHRCVDEDDLGALGSYCGSALG